MSNSPVRDEEKYLQVKSTVQDSGDPGYVNRLLIGTATTGLVRVEWVNYRYGQVIPTNWSMVEMLQFMNAYYPLRYQVADAQNMIVKEAVEKDFEWLFLIEHDTIIPRDCFVRINQYMKEKRHPVVSGLYYTRSQPSEPILYRGRGVGAYTNWKKGDRVWVDGVPTGCLLIHCGILRKMWEESEEYSVSGSKTRRVFHTPNDAWFDPESGQYNAINGTSDLHWCSRVMEGNYFAKAGWDEYQNMRWPFLVDTSIECRHINPNGEQF